MKKLNKETYRPVAKAWLFSEIKRNKFTLSQFKSQGRFSNGDGEYMLYHCQSGNLEATNEDNPAKNITVSHIGKKGKLATFTIDEIYNEIVEDIKKAFSKKK